MDALLIIYCSRRLSHKGSPESNPRLEYNLQFFAEKNNRPLNLSPNGAGRSYKYDKNGNRIKKPLPVCSRSE